jgi:hypothetical protein
MSQGMSLLDTESERSGYQRRSGMAIPDSTRCGAAREAARDVERHERATANEALHNRPNHEQSDHVEDQVRKVGMSTVAVSRRHHSPFVVRGPKPAAHQIRSRGEKHLMDPAAMATAANIATFAASSAQVTGTPAVRWRNTRFSSARGVAGRGTGMETGGGSFRPNMRGNSVRAEFYPRTETLQRVPRGDPRTLLTSRSVDSTNGPSVSSRSGRGFMYVRVHRVRPPETDGRPGTFTMLAGIFLTDQSCENAGNLWGKSRRGRSSRSRESSGMPRRTRCRGKERRSG